jgi:hypothetical protein
LEPQGKNILASLSSYANIKFVGERYPAMRSHDFTVTREEWELAVIEEAVHFSAVLPGTPSLRADFNNLREALLAVVKVIKTDPARGNRAMVYAHTKAGRFVMIPKPEWANALRRRGEAVA